jgi:hypothetical protein
MNAPPPSGRNARAALLALQRLLGEADRALSVGDKGSAEMAIGRVGSAFEQYRTQHQKDARERDAQTALEAARRAALFRLGQLLANVDSLLAVGDLDGVKSPLERAKEAVENSRALEESAHYSGVRSRFPSRFAKKPTGSSEG